MKSFRLIFAATVSCYIILLFSGCPDGSGPVGGNGNPDSLPENAEIAYYTDDHALAVTDTLGSPPYLIVAQSGETIFNMGITALWRPNSTPAYTHFLFRDSSSHKLWAVDQDGVLQLISEDVVPGAFSWSHEGSRAACVREDEEEGTTEALMRGVTVSDYDVFHTAELPWRILGPPTFSYLPNMIMAAVQHTTLPESSKVSYWWDLGNTSSFYAQALCPQKNNDGGDYAYLKSARGVENIDSLFYSGGHPDSLWHDFSGFGCGAVNFVWSPDNTKIALYTDVFTDDPRLVIIELETGDMTELTLDYPVVLPGDDGFVWSAPDWGPDGRRLVLLVRNGEVNQVVIVSLEGEVTVVVDGLSTDNCFRPTWKKRGSEPG